MTPLNKIDFHTVSAISENRWIGSNSRQNRHHLIYSTGEVKEIKSPFDRSVDIVAMYDRNSDCWVVGVFQGQLFSPFWREKEKIKKRADYKHFNDDEIDFRRGDHVIFSPFDLPKSQSQTAFLPTKVLSQFHSASKKPTKKDIFFLDLDTGSMVGLTCPMNVYNYCFSKDGLTVLVHGPKGFVIIDNPLF